jgi:hypothetical protein
LHDFEWQNGAIKPRWNGEGDVYGCGLLMNTENKLSIFFTVNGLLMGQFLWLTEFFATEICATRGISAIKEINFQ